MNEIERQLEKQKNEVYMLRSERNVIKASILGDTKSQQHNAVPFLSFFFNSTYRLVPVTMAVMLIVSVPVAYASQDSVPGDFLYGFEINVVEEIEELFYISDADQAYYHTARLEERLEELQVIVNKGNANELVVPVVSEIRDHTTKAIEALDAIPNDDSKLDKLVEMSALVEANADLINIAQDQEQTDSIVEDAQEAASEALATGVEGYTSERDADEISSAISENVEDINELSKEADSVTDAYVDNQLSDAAREITNEDLDNALTVLAETKVELRKQDLLNNSSQEIH